jgi:hypothetical protein
MRRRSEFATWSPGRGMRADCELLEGMASRLAVLSWDMGSLLRRLVLIRTAARL